LDFVAPDLDFIALGLDFVAPDLDFVAPDLDFVARDLGIVAENFDFVARRSARRAPSRASLPPPPFERPLRPAGSLNVSFQQDIDIDL